MTSARVALLVGVAVLVLVANVAASIGYMVVYGHVIDPGHEAKYYEDHIQVAAPYCSIVAGMPLMFAAGWWVTGWWGRQLGTRPACVVWIAYAAIDLTFVAAAVLMTEEMSLGDGMLVAISQATKLAAVLLGARIRLARPATSDQAIGNH